MAHLALDDRPLPLGSVVGRTQAHDVEGGEDGREGIAQLVAEDGEELVLAAVAVEELPRQGLGLLPRLYRVGDVDSVDHHRVHRAVHVLGRLGDEVEVSRASLVGHAPQPGVLGAEVRIAGALDVFQDFPGRARRGIRNRLAPALPDQVLAPDELLELRIGEDEDETRTAQDGDGRRRLAEERIEVLAMRLRLGPGAALALLQLVALAGALRGFLAQALLAPVLIEEEADLGDHRLGRERFHHVVHGALGVSLEDLLLLAAHGGDEDDGRVAGPLSLADERRRLESVEVRHLDVEEHERAVVVQEEAERLATRARFDQPFPERLEHRLEREQIGLAIVDDENGQRSRPSRICHRAREHNAGTCRA